MFIPIKTKLRAGGVTAAVAAVALVAAGCGSSSTTTGSKAAAATSSAAATTSAAAATSSSASSAAAAPAGKGTMVATVKSKAGTYLVGPNGRALYLWVADSGDKSSCNGTCASAWPPLITKGKPVAGHGAQAKSLGMITRSDGSEQVTYNGHPLYYFVADTAPGTTKGQGSDSFGAKWWLVTPAGAAITAGGSSAGGAASGGAASSSSSSSGWS